MIRTSLVALAFVALALPRSSAACTNYLVTPGASSDGSAFVTYSADSHELYGFLSVKEGAVHPAGSMRDVVEGDTGRFLGRIPEAARTFGVVGLMNEHQVAIGETTFGCRKELLAKEKGGQPQGTMDYVSLMELALERARTAREAVEIMAALSADHVWVSHGETFSVADPKETWLLEMIGRGGERKGTLWVALRVPDGYVTAHANSSRIRRFPLNDAKNALYAKDLIPFAREQGWFSGADAEFSFRDAFVPPSFGDLRFCEARVWRFFDRVAPSLKLSLDLVRGLPDQPPLPLWVKPDRPLGLADVMALMRDHFEGTELDLSKGVGAGPFHAPYRWRPMEWALDGKTYVHERAVSTQQTGYSQVVQLRAKLPNLIGGVYWLGVDDTFSTVYVPFYGALRQAPRPYAKGTADFRTFSWDAAFWVFNAVAQLAYARYDDVIRDVQAAQRELEGAFLVAQPQVEEAALALHRQSPEQARAYLAAYSTARAEETHARWRALWEQLFVKYLDGNVRQPNHTVDHPRYPDDWYRRIVDEEGPARLETKMPGEPEEE
jgi:dipeptidase